MVSFVIIIIENDVIRPKKKTLWT